MYLSSHEIARSREHALNNLLDLSAACIDASQRLSELISANSREAVHHNGRQWSHLGHGQLDIMTQFPTGIWLDSAARAGRLFDDTLEIIGEAHKAMIRNAESQVRVLDEIVFASINRATKSSPWEAEFALYAMKASLQGAEQTLHDISEAAIDTVAVAENEVHQAVAAIAVGSKPAPRRRAASTKKVDA